MTLSESVATLATLIPVLKANDAKFASDLIASFKKYGGLTPKQEPWIGKLIARASAPVAPVAAAVNVGGFAGVVALFTTAKAHLKFPKIRLVLNGTKIVLLAERSPVEASRPRQHLRRRRLPEPCVLRLGVPGRRVHALQVGASRPDGAPLGVGQQPGAGGQGPRQADGQLLLLQQGNWQGQGATLGARGLRPGLRGALRAQG